MTKPEVTYLDFEPLVAQLQSEGISATLHPSDRSPDDPYYDGDKVTAVLPNSSFVLDLLISSTKVELQSHPAVWSAHPRQSVKMTFYREALGALAPIFTYFAPRTQPQTAQEEIGYSLQEDMTVALKMAVTYFIRQAIDKSFSPKNSMDFYITACNLWKFASFAPFTLNRELFWAQVEASCGLKKGGIEGFLHSWYTGENRHLRDFIPNGPGVAYLWSEEKQMMVPETETLQAESLGEQEPKDLEEITEEGIIQLREAKTTIIDELIYYFAQSYAYRQQNRVEQAMQEISRARGVAFLGARMLNPPMNVSAFTLWNEALGKAQKANSYIPNYTLNL